MLVLIFFTPLEHSTKILVIEWFLVSCLLQEPGENIIFQIPNKKYTMYQNILLLYWHGSKLLLNTLGTNNMNQSVVPYLINSSSSDTIDILYTPATRIKVPFLVPEFLAENHKRAKRGSLPFWFLRKPNWFRQHVARVAMFFQVWQTSQGYKLS